MPLPKKRIIIEWEDAEYASISEMARKYNVSYSTAINWTNGKRKPRFMKNVKTVETR